MEQSKIIKAAIAAKKDGFVYMSSVVKSHFSTIYHNVNLIDDVILNGKWIACVKGSYNGWHGPIGISKLPEKCINKSEAINKYCK